VYLLVQNMIVFLDRFWKEANEPSYRKWLLVLVQRTKTTIFLFL